MSLCSNCGAELEDGAKFCPNCGTPLNGVSDAPKKPSKVIVAFPVPFGLIKGHGVVICNGEKHTCKMGENIELKISKATEITIKSTGQPGSTKIVVEPGDRVQVKTSGFGIRAAKVDFLTGQNFAEY